MLQAFLAFLLLLPLAGAAADFQVPSLSGPVVDDAAALKAPTIQNVGRYLMQHRENGGAQIQVVTLKSLEGLSIEEAAIKIADQWKIGKAKEDRGVLLVIAPNEKKLRIEAGLGVQGELPDVTASRIIREVMIPRIRDGSMDRAVIDGVLSIAHYTDPQLEGEQSAAVPAQRVERGQFPKIFKILFWVFLILIIFGGRRRGGGGRGGLAPFLLGTMIGSRSGYGGGFGGGFGGSGGGWSGGGGGFNGGGASGGW